MIIRKTTAILSGLLTLVLVLLIAIYIQYAILVVHTGFAIDQINIFYSMLEKTEEAEPTDTVGYLEYTVRYYPSGTKHVTGTPLDTTVEQVRSNVIAQIIDKLRAKTGKDLGDDPEAWIVAYKERSI